MVAVHGLVWNTRFLHFGPLYSPTVEMTKTQIIITIRVRYRCDVYRELPDRTRAKQVFDLEFVSRLLGFGGFSEDLFFFGVQALDAGIVDFFEDAIQLNLKVAL